MKKNCFVIQFIFLVTTFSLSSHSSAVMVGMSTEELTRASEVVIKGEAESVIARWSEERQIIFTTATIINIDVIKGKIVPHKIIVEYEGGEVGYLGHGVSDMAQISKGEKLILFLETGKSRQDGNVFNIVGKAQGKYTIDNNGIARKGGFSVISGEEIIDNNIPVDILINKIRNVK